MNETRNIQTPIGPQATVRVALVVDGAASVHSITHALEPLRERGLPGHEIDVIGTDASADRRLPAVAEVEPAFYPGLKLGVPGLLAVAEALTERRYDLVHVCAPGPAGLAAGLIARVIGLSVLGSYHTELQTYRPGTSDSPRVDRVGRTALAGFYRHCRLVLSPSLAAEGSLAQLGIPAARTLRWDRGVDLGRFSPAGHAPDVLPAGFNVLCVGPLSREQGVHLCAEAFLTARDRDPRMHLVLVGRGPEEEALRRRLGSAATFLGAIEGEALARVYASADLFMRASTIDTSAPTILEAQASGLPVLAVDAGRSADLIEDGRSGCVVAPDAGALASALRGLARREAIRERLVTGGLRAVRGRSWECSLAQLAVGYTRAIAAEREANGAIAIDTAGTGEAARAA